MIDYESAVRTVIQTGDYVLADLEDRIDTLWVEGRISAETRAELKVLAADNACETIADLRDAIQSLEARVLKLENEQYVVWTAGYQTKQHEIVRYDVTGDGELDLCRYDGGRASTSLSIGKIEGWHLLNRELENVATITRDADGGYVITPIPTAYVGE
jgi:hypothetical protein